MESLLGVRPADHCAFDLLALGEVLLRLDPGDTRVRTARSFRAWEGGGEYNVARALRRCFSQRTALVTALADNEVGRLIEDLILQGGVDTSFVRWMPADPLGAKCRNAINFGERGFGVRPAIVTFDRANTAASQMRPDDIDWDYIFGELGVRWFHTGGIFTLLSSSCGEVVERAITAANRHGTMVSYDVNYRSSHWSDASEIGRKQEMIRGILRGVDVLFAGPHDLSACLGLTSLSRSHCLDDSAWLLEAVEALRALFPRLQILAMTKRAVTSATLNRWGGMAWHNGRVWDGTLHPSLEVYDRVGGGDAFAAGFIFGLLDDADVQRALEYGIAHGALTMTTPGDSSAATLAEVKHLMSGGHPYARR